MKSFFIKLRFLLLNLALLLPPLLLLPGFTFANRDSGSSKITQLTSSFLLLFDTESSRQASEKQYWGGATMGNLAVQPKMVFDLKAKTESPPPSDD